MPGAGFVPAAFDAFVATHRQPGEAVLVAIYGQGGSEHIYARAGRIPHGLIQQRLTQRTRSSLGIVIGVPRPFDPIHGTRADDYYAGRTSEAEREEMARFWVSAWESLPEELKALWPWDWDRLPPPQQALLPEHLRRAQKRWGAQDAHIAEVRCQYLDFDGGTREEQQEAAQALSPSHVEHTGGKSLHPYLMLPSGQVLTPQQFKAAQRNLIAQVQNTHPAVGCDKAIQAASHIMRARGGRHPKTGAIATLAWNGGPPLDLQVVLARVEEEAARQATRPAHSGGGGARGGGRIRKPAKTIEMPTGPNEAQADAEPLSEDEEWLAGLPDDQLVTVVAAMLRHLPGYAGPGHGTNGPWWSTTCALAHGLGGALAEEAITRAGWGGPGWTLAEALNAVRRVGASDNPARLQTWVIDRAVEHGWMPPEDAPEALRITAQTFAELRAKDAPEAVVQAVAQGRQRALRPAGWDGEVQLYPSAERASHWSAEIYDHLGVRGTLEDGRRNLFVDISPTGEGKSFAVGESAGSLLVSLDPGDADMALMLYYGSSNYRNLPTAGIAKFKPLEGRDGGKKVEGDRIRTLTLQELRDGEIPDIEASCVMWRWLLPWLDAGYRHEDAVGEFCKQECPHHPQRGGSCPAMEASKEFWEKATGDDPQYIGTRRGSIEYATAIASTAPTLASRSLLIIDEADQLVATALRQRKVTITLLGRLLAKLPVWFRQRHPFELDLLGELLTRLMQTIVAQKTGHGLTQAQVAAGLAGWREKAVEYLQKECNGCIPEYWIEPRAGKKIDGTGEVRKAIVAAIKRKQEEDDSIVPPILGQIILGALAPSFPATAGASLSIDKVKKKQGEKPYALAVTSSTGVLQLLLKTYGGILVLDATANIQHLQELFSSVKAGESLDGAVVPAMRVMKGITEGKEGGNLQIRQVVDLGPAGRQRGEDIQKRIAALKDTLRQQGGLAVIDHGICLDRTRKGIDEFAHLTSDARGGNTIYQKRFTRLLVLGLPIPNLGQQLASYAALSRRPDVRQDDPAFRGWNDEAVAAGLLQAIGRLRAERRPDEQLEVVIVTDVDLSAVPGLQHIEKVSAADFTTDAAPKADRTAASVLAAIHQALLAGTPPTSVTIAAVARAVGITPRHVGRIASEHGGGWKTWVRQAAVELGLG